MFKDKIFFSHINILQHQKRGDLNISPKGPLKCLQENKCQVIDIWFFVEHFLKLKSAALFDKHFYKAKRVSIKELSEKQFDKHCSSTLKCFIKALAVLSLINTAIVL